MISRFLYNITKQLGATTNIVQNSNRLSRFLQHPSRTFSNHTLSLQRSTLVLRSNLTSFERNKSLVNKGGVSPLETFSTDLSPKQIENWKKHLNTYLNCYKSNFFTTISKRKNSILMLRLLSRVGNVLNNLGMNHPQAIAPTFSLSLTCYDREIYFS